MTPTPDDNEDTGPEAGSEAGPEEQPETRRRKEKVLHTRISTVLEEELKRTAEALRVPVSNLVRTILEDALNTVDAVGRAAEQELRGAAARLARERGRWRTAAEEGARSAAEGAQDVAVDPPGPVTSPSTESAAPAAVDPLAGVLGFQALVLAVETRCGSCGRILTLGEQAFLGVRDVPGPRIIVGSECVPGQQGEDK